MTARQAHITVCICAYKRPEMLRKLLENLSIQESEKIFEISVSIVDNDAELSARPVVDEFLINNKLEITYTHVLERNLALLRNRSIENSKGDFIAFIDDDELPTNKWLLLLYKTLQQYKASGALGPVLPKYQIDPPDWIVKGKLFERKRYKTGTYLQWWQTRTGNALMRRDIFSDPENLFDPKFQLGGEDDTLFERLIDKGHNFIWCDEAIVFEEIPARRLTVSYFLKRSRLIGYMTYFYLKDSRTWYKNVFVLLRSCFASIAYLILLPIYFIWGYHHYVDLLISLNHHYAVILSFLGLLKIKTRDF